MIWPFNARSKQPALPESPGIPTIQLVLETLERFKQDVLALDFVHADERDATTRGSLLVSIERSAVLARNVDWTAAGGATMARNLKERLRQVVVAAQERELASSFSTALADARDYYTNPFWVLSLYYKEMRQLPAAHTIFAIETPQAERVTFPSYTAVDEAFRPQLEALAVAWQVRADQELTVEDRYLVDAMANSYLPESINLYASLSKDSAFSGQASEMFAQQLNLFAARLATIEDATAKRQLQAMAVHSAFLEERLRPEPAAERLSIAN